MSEFKGHKGEARQLLQRRYENCSMLANTTYKNVGENNSPESQCESEEQSLPKNGLQQLPV